MRRRIVAPALHDEPRYAAASDDVRNACWWLMTNPKSDINCVTFFIASQFTAQTRRDPAVITTCLKIFADIFERHGEHIWWKNGLLIQHNGGVDGIARSVCFRNMVDDMRKTENEPLQQAFVNHYPCFSGVKGLPNANKQVHPNIPLVDYEKEREKEGQRRENAVNILHVINALTGAAYAPKDSFVLPIMARLADAEDDMEGIKKMLARQWKLWVGTEMQQYFRPLTLFHKGKFLQYWAERDLPLPQDITRSLNEVEAAIREHPCNRTTIHFNPHHTLAQMAEFKQLLKRRQELQALQTQTFNGQR